MKNKILIILLILSSGAYAQNDSIQKERYEVIEALFKNNKQTLDKNFLQYKGIGILIRNPELIDNLNGHCIDIDNGETNSFSEIVNTEEISMMLDQISWFSYYRTIDSRLMSDSFTIVDDCNNKRPAITLPLIFNNKAIINLNNKENEELLFVLVKVKNEWIVRCRKEIYVSLDD